MKISPNSTSTCKSYQFRIELHLHQAFWYLILTHNRFQTSANFIEVNCSNRLGKVWGIVLSRLARIFINTARKKSNAIIESTYQGLKWLNTLNVFYRTLATYIFHSSNTDPVYIC